MMRHFCLIVFCIVFATSVKSQVQYINGLNLKNGATVIEHPESHMRTPKQHEDIVKYSPESLLDDRKKSMWRSSERAKFPHSFVFELADDFDIENLVFDNHSEDEYQKSAAKHVKVYFSDESATKGFEEVLDIQLNENESNSVKFEDHDARWVKVEILSNYGNKTYTELKHFQAWGHFLSKSPEPADLTGTWNSNWGWVSLQKEANGSYTGCYEFENGEIISAALDQGRYFNFKWEEKSINNYGWGTVTLNEEKIELNGVWGKKTDKYNFGIWKLRKNSNSPKVCKATENKVETNSSSDYILQLQINSEETGEPVIGADVLIIGSKFSDTIKTFTDNAGRINKPIKWDTYTIQVTKQGFSDYNEPLEYEELDGDEAMIWKAIVSIGKLKAGDSFKLENIRFHRGKPTMFDESYQELDKLVTLMSSHPTMKIELGGHTDNTGSSRLNVILSEQRVAEVKKYLTEKGIKAKRIAGKGYGGSRPIAPNDKEENRKLNRRVEVTILEI